MAGVEGEALIEAVRRQRNMALDAGAVYEAQVKALRAELGEKAKTIAELTEKLKAAAPPERAPRAATRRKTK